MTTETIYIYRWGNSEKRKTMKGRKCVVLFGISIQRSSPKEIEAIYIKIRDGKILKSKEIGPKGEAVIDLDENGQVIGIEMLSPLNLWPDSASERP